MYLEQINGPEDVKKLNISELEALSKEIREALLGRLSVRGGHVGPNLGLVEVTTALHYVFHSPEDKFVFDVSHQSYTHKMLTGRKEAFMDEAHYGDVSGFTSPKESKHDFFNIGHTSTSISLACGLAKARDLKNEKYNVIALIGDGSLSGGEAYEGLNQAAEEGTNMIVIVNDNEMSIAENYGGLYKNLRLLRETEGKAQCNFFKAMGFEYHYVKDGHDYKELIDTFNKVKDSDHPVVVHIHTIKGKGYTPAELHKEAWHWGMPFEISTGETKFKGKGESYNAITGAYLLEKMAKDPKVAAITAGTPTVMGFTADKRKQAGKQFIDVGIAEETAVALASGMAANGAKPVFGVSSTFIQRTYDQISHDLCLNNNPAVITVFSASVFGMSDATHVGIFDIAMLSNIPNLVYLAPATKEEYLAMLEWGIEQTAYPVAIRVPGKIYSSGIEDTTDYSKLNKYQVTNKGKEVAILGLGGFYELGRQLAEALKESGMNATLINPKFITGLDEALLEELKKDHQLVITLEDGIIEGGFGQKIASFYGTSDMKVKNYGIIKSFPDRFVPEELLRENGISVEQITADIKSYLK